MRSLLLFFYRFRALFTFILLEIICAILIIQNTNYQKALFFNSSNSLIGGILATANNVTDFVNLTEVNQQLAEENARLHQELALYGIDSASNMMADSTLQFVFRTAEIVNNTVSNTNNTLTIRIGSKEGVKPGMGVIGGGGVVGKVRYAGTKFSVVTSLLNTDGLLSAQIKDKVALCTVSWDAVSANTVNLLYVPRQYSISVGDSVLTSGYNAVFPAGLLIGTISEVDLPEEATFHNIKVSLANDFRKLSHVSVIENRFKPELDSLNTLVEYE